MRWFLGILVFLLIALVLESGLLAYAMYVLLGVLVISRFLARRWVAGLEAARQCDRLTAEIGDVVTVTVTARNKGWLPVPWALLEDLLPRKAIGPGNPRLRVKGKRLQVRMIRAGGTVELRYRLKVRMRGYYQLGPLVMETGDLFGLHRRYRVAAEPSFLLVYPKVVPLQGYDLASRRPVGEIRLTHRLYEDPTRITGVRPYQPGDPMNRVHWRATARTGSLHCKVYEPSTIAGTTLLLDFHQAGYHAQGEPQRSELAVTTAVSLAHAVYQMNQSVGLITNGRDAVDRIRTEGWTHEDFRTRQAARKTVAMADQSERLQPVVVKNGRGVEVFRQIRETLARVELTDGLTFAELVVETAARLPRDATVVALLPDVPVETALALGNLRRQGFTITAILLMQEENQLHTSHGRLLAEGVLDVRHLKNAKGLPTLCQRQVMRTAAYAFALEV